MAPSEWPSNTVAAQSERVGRKTNCRSSMGVPSDSAAMSSYLGLHAGLSVPMAMKSPNASYASPLLPSMMAMLARTLPVHGGTFRVAAVATADPIGGKRRRSEVTFGARWNADAARSIRRSPRVTLCVSGYVFVLLAARSSTRPKNSSGPPMADIYLNRHKTNCPRKVFTCWRSSTNNGVEVACGHSSTVSDSIDSNIDHDDEQ